MGIQEDPGAHSSTRRNPSSLPQTLKHFHRDLLAGAVMGGVVHTIVAPIERAKLLLQTQESNIAIVGDSSGKRRFKGMFDFIHRTVREEGRAPLLPFRGSQLLPQGPLQKHPPQQQLSGEVACVSARCDCSPWAVLWWV
ncbi:BnaA10g10690D [Brassica napus]|uniref:ADP/ATP translocase n=1 Tax=Brassica napus TaxID=3708 RepID=A0A078H2D3_BRANA|nr:BnaA10g10690D [Brassica napus]